LDIVVAIDTSKSMLATDVQPDRLSRAKLAALDLMQQARSDRLGLVAFAGEAFLQCPLTSDDAVFRQCVEALDVNVISRGGTAIAEAISTAASAFKEKDNFKVLVLFTDGEDNEPGALTAAEAAAKEGMKIYTVGIGSPDGELLRVSDNKGRTDYIRDEQGNVVKSRLNEDLLRQIAGVTEGGFYLPLSAKTVDVLYENGLSQLPKSDQATRLTKQYHEQFRWPLGLAVLLLLAEMLLPERKRQRERRQTEQKKDRSANEPVRRQAVASAPATMAVVVVLLAATLSVTASPNKALKDYNEGEFDAALKEYQRVLQKKKDDPRLNYNAGAAAYREDKFEDAGKYFNQSISAEDIRLQERGYYNLGNVLYRVGEKLSDKDKKKEAWQTALTNYNRTLKLNEKDEDARFNYEFVKRKLEELEQEQQQQDQQQGGGDEQNQDQNDQQQQDQNQGQQNQDQQQQDQGQQDQQQKQGQDQSGQQDQKKEEQQQQSQASQGQQKDNQPEQKPGQQAQQGQPQQAKAMSAQEAERMLEAQEGDEQFLQFGQGQPQEDQSRPFKDW
jgi:Ca-activated chloride channel homolog